MDQQVNEKLPYEAPTLEKREQLSDVIEGVAPIAVTA